MGFDVYRIITTSNNIVALLIIKRQINVRSIYHYIINIMSKSQQH